ncbi:AAA family ATPase [Actinocrispum sp. NPDC049592]|uniref:helix-turn-helix transcriptional regulator n=1 Tax=Actinocrispum sp. NPDC049592 TaxID=3154835 RepID=UPI0034165A6C
MPDVPRLGSGISLVARGRELSRLRAAFDRAAGGTAGAVLIAGDAGVGKTRMVEEIGRIATAGGAIVLSGRCVDVGEAGLPYLPFAEALSQVRREDLAGRPGLSMLLPELAPAANEPPTHEPQRFVPAFGKVQGMQPRREQDVGQLQLFDAVYALLTDLAEEHCVVLVIEDLHWADSSTRGLLSFLLSRLRSQRLLIVCTYRTDDLHRRHPLRPLLAELVRLPAVERLDLPPFDKTDARTFVAALGEGGIEADTVRKVADQSEGNAFFAEELLAALSDPDCGIPASLVDVLLNRVERLSEPAQQVIRLASVAGRTVRHETLHDVGELDDRELEEALREAVQHHVLVLKGEGEQYSFRHALLREAVYGDLLPGERVRMHAAYARYKMAHQDERGNAAALAYHSLESNSLPVALMASVAAAKEATKLGAPGDALRHLEQALRLWDSVDESARPADTNELTLLRKASWAAGTSGEPERAIAYARSAVKLADKQGDAQLSAEVRRRLAQTLLTIDGGEDESRTVIEAAWEKVAELPPSQTRAWVLAVQARILRNDRELELARERAELAVADARAVGAVGAESDALATLAVTAEATGDVEKARELLVQAKDRAAEVDAITVELRARFYLGLNYYEEGMLAEAVRTFDDGVARAKHNGLPWSDFGVELRILQILAHFATGDWDAAAAAAEQPRRISSTVSARLAVTGLHVTVGRGQFADAERLLANVRPEWPKEIQIALNSGSLGAEVAMWRGKPELAVERVHEILDWSKRAGGAWQLSGIKFGALGAAAAADLAHRASLKNDADGMAQAIAQGEKFVEHARDTALFGTPRNGSLGPEGRAWLARAEAELTRLHNTSDPEAWAKVVDAFGYGTVYDQALARWRLAEAMLGADRRDDAVAELRAAYKVAERLGAKPLAEAITQLARRGRISLSDDQPRDAVDLFTPREQSVLRLVALGQTNRQVGEELYISEKTVSVHLSRIMAKLGASRRAEAVAIAYDRGLLD